MTLARRARARPCACPRLRARVGRGPSGTGRGGGHRFRSVPSPAPSWKLSISRAQLRGASRGEKVRAPTRCGQRSDLRAGALQARSDRRFLSAGALRGVLTDGRVSARLDRSQWLALGPRSHVCLTRGPLGQGRRAPSGLTSAGIQS